MFVRRSAEAEVRTRFPRAFPVFLGHGTILLLPRNSMRRTALLYSQFCSFGACSLDARLKPKSARDFRVHSRCFSVTELFCYYPEIPCAAPRCFTNGSVFKRSVSVEKYKSQNLLFEIINIAAKLSTVFFSKAVNADLLLSILFSSSVYA